VLSFNVRNFVALAEMHPRHGSIILAVQANWTLADLIAALRRLLSEMEDHDLVG
jgi:hypothetical protein